MLFLYLKIVTNITFTINIVFDLTISYIKIIYWFLIIHNNVSCNRIINVVYVGTMYNGTSDIAKNYKSIFSFQCPLGR